jgi:hypothetical protein
MRLVAEVGVLIDRTDTPPVPCGIINLINQISRRVANIAYSAYTAQKNSNRVTHTV